MTAIVKILSLLPILYGEYEEVKLISQLNHLFNFDHNIFLLHASADKNRFINEENTPKSLYVFNVDNKITGLEGIGELKSKNTFMVAATVSATLDENLKLLNKLKKILRIKIDMKIGIFFMNSPSTEDLNDIFKWCKNNLIVKIFAATYIQGPSEERLLNIFTFEPFGPFDVKNATSCSATCDCFFPSLKSDFQRDQLVLLLAPYTKYSDGHLWRNVFHQMIARTRIVLNNSTNTRLDGQLIKGAAVIPQLYVIKDLHEALVYPLRVDSQVLIVPEATSYREFSAYLRTVTSDKFFGYSSVTISAMMLLLCVIRYIEQKKILIFESVADVLNLLMHDNTHIKYQRLSRVEVALIVPLTFVGFVFVNGILSNLLSYLTRPVLNPQIKTAEDLYRSPINIVVPNEIEKRVLINVLVNIERHTDWSDRISIMEPIALSQQLRLFNRTIATPFTMEDVTALLEVQKRLNIKGYHVAQIETSHSPVTYYVNGKFLFFERLNEIIHRIQSAGLYNKWLTTDRTLIVKHILQENIENLKNGKGSDAESEGLLLSMFIVYGWIAGVIVFIIEIIWKNFNFTSMKRFIK